MIKTLWFITILICLFALSLFAMYAAIKTFLIVYFIVVLLLYLGQRKMLYFPTPDNSYSPELEVSFSVNNQKIQAWKLNPEKAQALMYFGGNAESVEANIEDYSNIFGDYTVYLISYRGYGASTGSPTEEALFKDSLAIYDLLTTEHNNISVMGRSLGSGIAVHLAYHREISKMILITPYHSILKVAQGIFWMFPMSALLKDKYESWRKVGSIKTDSLLLIAEHDEAIPPKYGHMLASYFNQTKPLVKVIKQATHNNIEQFEEFQQALIQFTRN